MATDEEIIQLWGSLPKKTKKADAIIRLYRMAENEGRRAGISALEKELLSDSTVGAALQAFGWGRKNKTSLITMRAVMREALRMAKEKTEKQK